MARVNRFRVVRKPTQGDTGNYAVVSIVTGRIKSRHATVGDAVASARIRGRAVRRARR